MQFSIASQFLLILECKVPPLITQKKNQFVSSRQKIYLWVRRPSLGREIGQGQELTKHKLVHDEYLSNLRPNKTFGQMYQQDKLGENDQEQLG